MKSEKLNCKIPCNDGITVCMCETAFVQILMRTTFSKCCSVPLSSMNVLENERRFRIEFRMNAYDHDYFLSKEIIRTVINAKCCHQCQMSSYSSFNALHRRQINTKGTEE